MFLVSCVLVSSKYLPDTWLMLSRKYRLKERQTFQQIYRRGPQTGCGGFNIHTLANHLEYNRLGVVVSTKISKKAAVRNRIRRRLHGFIDELWQELKPGQDLIITVRGDISTISANELRAQLEGCLKKLGLLG